jgi:hypothetical protein
MSKFPDNSHPFVTTNRTILPSPIEELPMQHFSMSDDSDHVGWRESLSKSYKSSAEKIIIIIIIKFIVRIEPSGYDRHLASGGREDLLRGVSSLHDEVASNSESESFIESTSKFRAKSSYTLRDSNLITTKDRNRMFIQPIYHLPKAPTVSSYCLSSCHNVLLRHDKHQLRRRSLRPRKLRYHTC